MTTSTNTVVSYGRKDDVQATGSFRRMWTAVMGMDREERDFLTHIALVANGDKNFILEAMHERSRTMKTSESYLEFAQILLKERQKSRRKIAITESGEIITI